MESDKKIRKIFSGRKPAKKHFFDLFSYFIGNYSAIQTAFRFLYAMWYHNALWKRGRKLLFGNIH